MFRRAIVVSLVAVLAGCGSADNRKALDSCPTAARRALTARVGHLTSFKVTGTHPSVGLTMGTDVSNDLAYTWTCGPGFPGGKPLRIENSSIPGKAAVYNVGLDGRP